MIGRALAVWAILAILATLNGITRESLLKRKLNNGQAHVASTLILVSVISAVTWLSLPWIGPPNAFDAWQIGAGWMGLTLAFEFLAGHYLFGNPWEKILADYNLLKGRVWPLVPLTMLLAPPFFRR